MRKPGSVAKVVGGSRLRSITKENKLADTGMQEGALVDVDRDCVIVGYVDPNAYVINLKFEGKILTGWVYSHELAGKQD